MSLSGGASFARRRGTDGCNLPIKIGGKHDRPSERRIPCYFLNVIESFNGVLTSTVIILWLTLDYLPRTTLDPPSTLAIYLAVEGLLVLPVFARAGHIADAYAPYKVAELSQYLNIASMAVLTCLLLLAAPSHPFVTLAVMALIQMTFMNRGILFDSAVMVIITTRILEDKQPAFFTWNFRANLVTPLTAPLLGAWLFQHNVYVAIAVCATLSLVSALLLAWTRKHKVPSSAFVDKPTLTVVRYAR